MYCDDSGNNVLSDGNYYVISGVIVHESNYDFVDDKMEEYKSLNFIGNYKDAEIHPILLNPPPSAAMQT
jgi:hypothetical protein